MTIRKYALAVSFMCIPMGALAAPAKANCSIDSVRAIASKTTIIDTVEKTANPVPHCRIDGHIITHNPGPNRVNFRLQLPDEGWQQRYYFIGLGGSAGYVPSDSQIPAGNPLLGGFAVAGTDTGRQGSMGDWSFLRESEAKALDHNHRAAHVTAVATQALTKAYYQSETLYRYTSGCSGGGRMSVQAIENYPQDYDGVVLGAPGGRSSASFLKFIHASQQMYREPGAWLSPAKLAMVESKVLAACDGTDGLVDGLVSDHRLCKFDVKSLQCPKSDAPNCLSKPEVNSILAILDGPKGPDGKLLAQPMQISNMSLWSQFLGATPPPWSSDSGMANMQKASAGYIMASTLAEAYFGEGFDVLKLDLANQKDLDKWWAAAKRTGFGVPYKGDLKPFYKAGGKVIMWNGRSDPCCGDLELENYYHDVEKSVGGAEQIAEFARLYQIPGMGHCGSGTGPVDAPDQFIKAMTDWVEKGIDPEAVVASRGKGADFLFADPKTGQVSGVIIPPAVGGDRDFLLCPYPKMAVFNASLPATDKNILTAKTWSCRAP